jgi:hypothetical protein
MRAVVLVLASSTAASAQPCATTRVPHPVSAFYAEPPTTRVIYLDKDGGTFDITAGPTDSATNAANLIATGDSKERANVALAPIESSFDWPYILACVKQQYQPYNVTVVDTRPTSGTYVEALIGGDGTANGLGSDVLGVAAADNFCGITETGIAFAFSTNHLTRGSPNDELCTTIAHEVGHLFALEHEISGVDTMSYVAFATAMMKSFTEPSSHCGTDVADQTACSCEDVGGVDMTSSAVRLAQYVGPRPSSSDGGCSVGGDRSVCGVLLVLLLIRSKHAKRVVGSGRLRM